MITLNFFFKLLLFSILKYRFYYHLVYCNSRRRVFYFSEINYVKWFLMRFQIQEKELSGILRNGFARPFNFASLSSFYHVSYLTKCSVFIHSCHCLAYSLVSEILLSTTLFPARST